MGKKTQRTEFTVNLEPEEVVINGTVYSVNVLMGGAMLDVIGDDGNPDPFTMLEKSVKVDGEFLQNTRETLPVPVMQILVEAVNRVNGYDGDQGNG